MFDVCLFDLDEGGVQPELLVVARPLVASACEKGLCFNAGRLPCPGGRAPERTVHGGTCEERVYWQGHEGPKVGDNTTSGVVPDLGGDHVLEEVLRVKAEDLIAGWLRRVRTHGDVAHTGEPKSRHRVPHGHVKVPTRVPVVPHLLKAGRVRHDRGIKPHHRSREGRCGQPRYRHVPQNHVAAWSYRPPD